MSAYPQHEKLKAAHAQQQDSVLSDFIDFLRQTMHIHFGVYPEPCANPGEDEENGECGMKRSAHYSDRFVHGGTLYHSPADYLIPIGGESTYSAWIAEFYGIDKKLFDAEKEAMYQELVAANRR